MNAKIVLEYGIGKRLELNASEAREIQNALDSLLGGYPRTQPINMPYRFPDVGVPVQQIILNPPPLDFTPIITCGGSAP